MPESNLDLFHFEEDKPSFEALSRENGFRFWMASDLAQALGYQSVDSMSKAIQRAMTATVTLNIAISENFSEIIEDGTRDWRLSRFACYLTAMNADPRKPGVAKAQAWFATIAESFRQYMIESDSISRVVVRGEITESEKSLSATAGSHGVVNYAFFQNSGYRGLYNMNFADLKAMRGVPAGRSPLDYMGSTELAANLFRITQTEEVIKNDNVQGQTRLQETAFDVGRKVRNTMRDISGAIPEQLPVADDIKGVQKGIKDVRRDFVRLDKPKRL
jgi:DNA-damage-inducible protein D